MIVKLLTEHNLEYEAAEAHPSLHLSKCQIVGNHMHWLLHVFHFCRLICALRVNCL